MNEKSAAVAKNPELAEKLVEAYLVERTALTDNTKFDNVTQGHLRRATQEFLETEHPLVGFSHLRVRSDGVVLVNVRRDPLAEVNKQEFAANLSSTLSNDFNFLQAKGGASLVVKFLGDTEEDTITYDPATVEAPAPAPTASTELAETMVAVDEFLNWAYAAILKVSTEPMEEQFAKDREEIDELKARIAEGYDANEEVQQWRNTLLRIAGNVQRGRIEELERKLAGFVRRGSKETPGTLAERQSAFLDGVIALLHEENSTLASSRVRASTEHFRIIRERAARGQDLAEILAIVPDTLRMHGLPASEDDLPASYFSALGWVKPTTAV